MSIKSRYIVFICLIFIVFVGIFVRLGYLMVVQHEFYLDRSNKQIKKLIRIDTSRGRILDRNMYPLAVSQPVVSVYASPRLIPDKLAFATRVAPLLNMEVARLARLVSGSSNFVWLKRKVSDVDVDKIKSISPRQLNVLMEEKRVYPNDQLVSDVIGFVGMDEGLAGLEYQFDQFLTGEQGFYIIQGDPGGIRIISSDKTLMGKAKGFSVGNRGAEASSLKGGSLVLTVDYRVQYLVEQLLSKNIERVEAESGQVIVMDVTTGEIIAMADLPNYDPNYYQQHPYSVLKNSCVVDVLEPGSIFKLVTYAGALNEQIVTPGTMIDIPERLVIQRRPISEAHDREPDAPSVYPAEDIIRKSMNVGTVLLAQQMGKSQFYKYIEAFGFGKKTGIQLPGETRGLLRPLSDVADIDHAVMSFGQGISVTPIQMVAAIAAIANDGVYVAPRIVKHQTDHDYLTVFNRGGYREQRVISSDASRGVLMAMERVVTAGTGRYAAVPGYRIGGKTGTAQKPLDNGLGYEEGAYIASFVGVLPIQQPKYAILVIVHEPQTTIWGSTAAAPLFSDVARVLIDYYNIEPDVSQLQYMVD